MPWLEVSEHVVGEGIQLRLNEVFDAEFVVFHEWCQIDGEPQLIDHIRGV